MHARGTVLPSCPFPFVPEISMSSVWSRRARWGALPAVVALAAACTSVAPARVAEPVKVKVFVAAMFEI